MPIRFRTRVLLRSSLAASEMVGTNFVGLPPTAGLARGADVCPAAWADWGGSGDPGGDTDNTAAGSWKKDECELDGVCLDVDRASLYDGEPSAGEVGEIGVVSAGSGGSSWSDDRSVCRRGGGWVDSLSALVRWDVLTLEPFECAGGRTVVGAIGELDAGSAPDVGLAL